MQFIASDPNFVDTFERVLCERSFYEFVKKAWSIVDPDEFIETWHIKCLCVHAEAFRRHDFTVGDINIPPGHAKPCCIDGFVLEKTKGRILLGDVVVGDEVLTHKGRFRKVLAVHEQGVIQTVKVTTYSGRTLELAPDHPVLTPRGWIEAGNLKKDDVLAEVHQQEECGTSTIIAEEARLLGYLIGDGCVKYSTKTFTNQDKNVIDDFRFCASKLGFKTTEPRIKKGFISYCVNLKGANGCQMLPLKLGQIRVWLKEHGLDGKCSYDKRVPKSIMAANNKIIAEFLGAYWSCDGYIRPRGYDSARGKDSCAIGCDTVCEGLAKDIQHLLNRLGISSRIRTKKAQLKTRIQGDFYISYSVTLSRFDMGSKFCSLIPIKHEKGLKKDQFDIRTGFDRILNEDPFVSLEKNENKPCRCLTVEDDHSFVYNDIAVHNSLIFSVMLPSWIWTTEPHLRILSGSHNIGLAIRDTLKTRRLIESAWYQKHWGGVFQLTSDQNTKSNYENDKMGSRVAFSTSSGTTGLRGDFIILDDALSEEQSRSDVEREAVNQFLRGTLFNRQNIAKDTGIIGIGQRFHVLDYHSVLLSLPGCFHLVLHEEFIPEEAFESPYFKDPRTIRGEVIWKTKKFDGSPTGLPLIKMMLGSAAYSAQYQQKPKQNEGSIIKRVWFPYYRKSEIANQPGKIIMGCDMAAEEGKDNDYTVFHVVIKIRPKFYHLAMYRKKVQFHQMKKDFIEWADRWNPAVIYIERASNGLPLISEMSTTKYARRINPPRVELGKKIDPGNTGGKDKVARVLPVTPTLEAGYWCLPEGEGWTDTFIDECISFPNGEHDDIVDPLALILNNERSDIRPQISVLG